MDLLVGGILVAHLPAVGGAGGRADEEELVDMGRLEQVVAARGLGIDDRRRLAKVDLGLQGNAAVGTDGMLLQQLAHLNGSLFGHEGAQQPAEGGQRREGIEGRDGTDL